MKHSISQLMVLLETFMNYEFEKMEYVEDMFWHLTFNDNESLDKDFFENVKHLELTCRVKTKVMYNCDKLILLVMDMEL